MGSVRMGVPTGLVCAIRTEFGADCFVETGTYQGGTAVWAAREFSAVYTIEASAALHGLAVAHFSSLKNVQFLLGESPVVLRRIMPALPARTVFWLDAHWSGGPTHGENNECPLLDEIRAIDGREAFILIDDARLFLAPPPLPHKADQWPDVATILGLLREKDPSRYIVILEDLIIAVPGFARDFMIRYCRQVLAGARLLLFTEARCK